MENMKEHKAIALFSGGLDSILAVIWMQSRGYEIYPVFFRAPYLKSERAELSAKQNSIDLEIVDISTEHHGLLHNPAYGFGKRLNPCIDCHGLMFKTAAALLEKKSAHFLISGEVLGQRPKSQRRDALDSVSRLSGVRDLIVRPLSQLLLPPTKPVREGWVALDDLLAFQGRKRTAQQELALQLGIKDYPSPAGGCLLTDRNYCLRLQDLLDKGEDSLENLELLSQGRHFRLAEGLKLIVGRDEADNEALDALVVNGVRLQAERIMGPVGLLVGRFPTEAELQLALSIFLYFHPKAGDKETIIMQTFKAEKPVGETQLRESGKCNHEVMKKYHISYS